jgi:leader peptidase (prepilin peptidase)/N-methyltransferase
MTAAESIHLVCTLVAGGFGLLFGSFLNVCIARMPEDRSVVWPGSACPACGSPIKPYDNVPVLAWFWLRGAIPAGYKPRLLALLALGALQGVEHDAVGDASLAHGHFEAGH